MKATNANLDRMDRLAQESIHDPYKNKLKLHDPTVCPECSAVFSNGRWQWLEPRPLDSHQEMCPACHRVHDHYPAGVIRLTGAFALDHKAELLDLVRHHEEAETANHPLHRVMSIEEKPGHIVINTTDIHLPKRIGNALHHAYKGSLEIHYAEDEYFVRILWTREP